MEGERHNEQVRLTKKMARGISTLPWSHDVMHMQLQQQLDTVSLHIDPAWG